MGKEISGIPVNDGTGLHAVEQQIPIANHSHKGTS